MATVQATSGQAQSDPGKVEVGKTAQAAAGQHHGLFTPEPSLGPDEARNQADEQRRQAASSETTEQQEGINKPSTQSNHDSAAKDPSSSKSKGETTEQQEVINTPSIQSNHDSATKDSPKKPKDSSPKKPKGAPTSQGRAASKTTEKKVGKKRVVPNDKQKGLAVTKVLKCDSTAYFEILGVKPESSKEDKDKAYVRLWVLTNPKNNTSKGAGDAHKRVVEAGKQLSLDVQDTEIDEMEVDFEEMDEEPTDPKSTLTRADFLQNVYNEAEPHLMSLMKDPNGTEAKGELEKLNNSIEQRNREHMLGIPETDRVKALIDVPTFLENFQKAKPVVDRLEKDPTDASAKRKFDKINKSLKELNQKHGYPERWVLTEPKQEERSATKVAKKVQPGLTRKGERILGCRKFWGGNRFYVETEVNGLPYCEIRTADEIGGQASKAYLNEFDGKVMVGEGTRKYRKKDGENSYGGVIHVACKPPLTRTIGKDKDRKPRRPLTDIIAFIDAEETWITYSDLTTMCGKVDALADIEEYYDDRDLKYPWDVPPKRILEVVEEKKSDGSEDSGSASETTTSKASTGSSWTPINGDTAKEDSATQNSKDNNMQSELNELKEQNANLNKQMTEMMEMMKELRTAQKSS